MAVFPVLDCEDKLQHKDMTRLNAEKSFVAPRSATALTTLTIKPGLDGSAQSVFDADSTENRYLDWVFNTWNFDIVTGFNDKIDFEQGGTARVATLTQGTYTLAQLATEIATQLNAVVGISGVFSVSVSSDEKLTISNSTTQFVLKGADGANLATSLLPHIGFAKRNDSAATSRQGERVEYAHKQVTVSANNGEGAQTVIKYIQLFSVLGDRLFSGDGDIMTWEPDIMKWVQKGRSSFLNIHREAQEQILYWLDKQGYVNIYREKFTKKDLVDLSEVRDWSAFKALSIIFWGLSNKENDVFLKKHYEYLKKANEARDRAVLRIDIDEDGEADQGEELSIQSGVIVRR